jgi:molecular chaperone DnaK (HSP70)
MNYESKYCIGIDLGTTNSSVAYIDTENDDKNTNKAVTLPIEQIVASGEVGKLPLLPSAIYIPGEHELADKALSLPWDEHPETSTGLFALNQGTSVPHRLISSAKSWLCHSGIDRKSPILPCTDEDDVVKYSPVKASSLILNHIKNSWNNDMGSHGESHRFENQQIVLTVPASFDAVARDLTLEAATESGLDNITILEEPQAALYSWIGQNDEWRKQVTKGDIILVVDVGGGTSDFSLMKVDESDGDLTLERFAAGNHILLGGDNFDLTLARHLEAGLKKKLSPWQLSVACHGCRMAKEEILGNEDSDEVSVVIPGRGSSLIGGSLKGVITRKQVTDVLLDGFFPQISSSERPVSKVSGGFVEIGLPYEADPAITKHLAAFLSAHNKEKGRKLVHPTAILFNGGVFKASLLRDRISNTLSSWIEEDGGSPVRKLEGFELDLAVARGGADYGRVRRGKGFRIRGGTSRSYYVGVEVPMPAVPGLEPPVRAICIAPCGMEEGTSLPLPDRQFGITTGSKARFRFFSSSTRNEDKPGTVIEDWEEQDIVEVSPIETTLVSEDREEGSVVTVTLNSEVTETGTLQLFASAIDKEDERYRLEFNIRTED